MLSPFAGDIGIRLVTGRPIPWDVLTDHLWCEVIVRKSAREQRIRECWIHPKTLARALQGLAGLPGSSDDSFELVEAAGVSFRSGPNVTADLIGGPMVLVRAKPAAWRIRIPGSEAARVAEALKEFQHLSEPSEPSLAARMKEFVHGMDTASPLLIQVGPEPLSVELTPESFFDAMFATAESIFLEDARRRSSERPSEAPKLSKEERQMRDHYRKILQQAFNQFAERFSIERKDLPVG